MPTLPFDVYWRDHGAKAGLKGLSNEAREAAKRQDEFKAKAALAGAVVGAALFKLGKDAVATASDIGESTSKVGVVFGKAGASVVKFADTTASSLGISKAAALEAAGTFGNLFVSLKLPQDQAAKMSTRMVQLAADMASFNNASPEDALEALRSGLVGETEPLRRFGVNIQDATLRQKALELGLISTTKDALDPAVKAQASYALILEQTKTAQGDFARTSGGLANQQRILKAEFSDLQGELGAKLLPATVSVTRSLVDLVEFVDAHGRPIAAFAIGIGTVAGAVWAVNKASAAFKATSAAWETATTALAGLNREGSRTRSALGAVGGPGGALGILGGALAIGTVAWSIYAKRQAESKARIDDVRESLDQQTGAITGNTRELAFSTLKQQGAIDAAKVLGISLKDLTDAALGNADAQARVRDRIDAVIGPMDEYRVLTGQQVEAIKKVRGAVGENNDELNKARKALEDQRAAGITAAEGTTTLTDAVKGNTRAVEDNAAVFEHRDDVLTKRSAQRDYEQAVDDLTASIKENGKAHDTNTAAGRANMEALDRVARAANEYQDKAKKAGDSTAQLSKAQREAYNRLYDTMYALTGSKKKADDYARAVLGIPKKSDTKVSTDTKSATRAVDTFERRLAGIPDKTVTVGAVLKFPTGWAEYRAGERKAFGGQVGDGYGTVDEVPALLMRGEHVWTTREVKAAGGHSAVARIRKAAAAGRLAGYAAGGPVGSTSSAAIGRGVDHIESVLEDLAIKFGRDLQSNLIGAGSLGGTGWARQWAVLHRAFPGAALHSAFRPGAITASGNTSYHALGRAIDVTPSMAIFDWIVRNYGRTSKEVIYSPAGGRQLKDGRPHMYGEPVRGMHWSHVHWAYDQGGYADGPGLLPKGPAPERVLSPQQTRSFENLVRVLDRSGGATVVNVNLSAERYVGPRQELLRELADAARSGQLAGVLRAAGVAV